MRLSGVGSFFPVVTWGGGGGACTDGGCGGAAGPCCSTAGSSETCCWLGFGFDFNLLFFSGDGFAAGSDGRALRPCSSPCRPPTGRPLWGFSKKLKEHR